MYTGRADMQFKVVFLVALISVNTIYIHIPCPELNCFTVTVFQDFRFECMVSTVYVSKQQRLLDLIIIIV